MLKITKKAELKPNTTTNEFKSEKEEQHKIRDILSSGKEINFEEVQQIYKWTPSINAQILAHFMQVVTSKMTHENYQASMDFLLYLYALPHQQSELRHFLKHTFKIDPILLLLALLEKKHNLLALKLASTILDSYTLALMLNGKQVIQAWRKSINQQRHQYQALEEIQKILKQFDQKEQNSKSKSQGFRRVIIPL